MRGCFVMSKGDNGSSGSTRPHGWHSLFLGEQRSHLSSGRRLTTVRPMVQGAEEVIIEDADFRAADSGRQLQERWTGETRFEVKASTDGPQQAKRQRKLGAGGAKRKSIEVEADPEGIHPEVQEINPLTSALRDKGPEAVDGHPRALRREGVASTDCAVPECVLPGGHYGPRL